jgi:hypothetical protein
MYCKIEQYAQGTSSIHVIIITLALESKKEHASVSIEAD